MEGDCARRAWGEGGPSPFEGLNSKVRKPSEENRTGMQRASDQVGGRAESMEDFEYG